MNRAFILALIALAGCSTMQYTPNPTSGSRDGVQVLYDYPKAEYDNLGVISFDFYRPGLREPTVSDALPDLKTKVSSVGGNALIIRDQRIGRQNSRFLQISAEVLRIK